MSKPLKHHLAKATGRHAALVARRAKLAAEAQAQHDARLAAAHAAAAKEAAQAQQLAEVEPPQPSTALE